MNAEDTISQKKKKVLSLKEKIAVIKKHREMPSADDLACFFNCGKTQIYNILRFKDDYLEELEMNNNPTDTRLRQSIRVLVINVILFEYVARCLLSSIALNDLILRTMGGKLVELLNIKNLKLSNTWLGRFKLIYRFSDEDLSSPTYDPIITCKSLKLEDIIEDVKKGLKLKNLPLNMQNMKDVKKLKKYQKMIMKKRLHNKFSLPVLWNAASKAVSPKQTPQKTTTDNQLNDNEKSDEKSVEYSYVALNSSDNNDSKLDSCANTMPKRDINSNSNGNCNTYKKAIEILKLLEEFTLLKEDLRGIGLINQLEIYFQEKLIKNERKI